MPRFLDGDPPPIPRRPLESRLLLDPDGWIRLTVDPSVSTEAAFLAVYLPGARRFACVELGREALTQLSTESLVLAPQFAFREDRHGSTLSLGDFHGGAHTLRLDDALTARLREMAGHALDWLDNPTEWGKAAWLWGR